MRGKERKRKKSKEKWKKSKDRLWHRKKNVYVIFETKMSRLFNIMVENFLFIY